MSRRWRQLGLVSALLLGSAFVLVAARDWLLPPVAYWLDVGEAPRRADYVMVLGGEENTRPFVAAALMRVGLVEKALVPRVEESPDVLGGLRPPVHEIIRRVLRYRGIPDRDILLIGRDGKHTYDESRFLAQLLENRPDATVAVVTSFFCARRARWIFRRVLGERAEQIHFVSAPHDRFGCNNWWQCEMGFASILGEYLKLTFYLFRYSWGPYWVLGLMALAAVLVYRRRRAARKGRGCGQDAVESGSPAHAPAEQRPESPKRRGPVEVPA